MLVCDCKHNALSYIAETKQYILFIFYFYTIFSEKGFALLKIILICACTNTHTQTQEWTHVWHMCADAHGRQKKV